MSKTRVSRRKSSQAPGMASQGDLRRILNVVGEGYLEGLEPEPALVYPSRVLKATPGVEDAPRLLGGAQAGGASLALRLDRRTELVLDFGAEMVGMPELVFGESQPGELRIDYGEDLRECLGESGPPMQRDTVRAKANYTWTSPRRRAFQFVRIRAVGSAGHTRLLEVRLRSRLKPLPRTGWFRSSDPRLDDVWRSAVRTVHVCMQEQLEDGVKRDCCLWAGDLRPAGLAALYAFGASEYLKHNLRQFIPWRLHEGAIPPMVGHSYVMYDYVAWWTVAVHDVYRYDGDAAFVRDVFPVVKEQVAFLQRRRAPSGLVNVQLEFDAPFTDWTCTRDKTGEVAFMQALYYRMLLDGAELAQVAGEAETARLWREEAGAVKAAANVRLWSESLDAFADFRRGEVLSARSSEDGLCLAALFDLAEAGRGPKLLDRLRDRHWTTYGSLYLDRPYDPAEPDCIHTLRPNYIPVMINGYEVAAFLKAGRVDEALELIRRCYGNMLEQGATTFWEAVDENTGLSPESLVSLCHSWTGLVAYLLQAEILGVRPAEAGFAGCVIEPKLGPLREAAGVVPTPKGLVAVRAERRVSDNERRVAMHVSTPNGMPATVVLRPTTPEFRLRIGGEAAPGHAWHRLDDGRISIPLPPGDHELECAWVDRPFTFLPESLARNLYVPGSLRALPEGFAFKVRGAITPMAVSGFSPILLDGVRYPEPGVCVPGTEDMKQACDAEPAFIGVGQEVELAVAGKRPEPGEHTLQFDMQVSFLPDVAITVTVRDSL